MNEFMLQAIEQAKKSLNEGGIPIGSVIEIDGKIVGKGHNQRVQNGSPILHGEMSAFADAGRLSPAQYRKATLYTTLSPCLMCSGAILLYKIPKVVIAENITFMGDEEHLKANGVELLVLQDQSCIEMMNDFIKNKPELWFEDIGKI
jgi:cytosine/creatinine deaminase